MNVVGSGRGAETVTFKLGSTGSTIPGHPLNHAYYTCEESILEAGIFYRKNNIIFGQTNNAKCEASRLDAPYVKHRASMLHISRCSSDQT